MALLSKDPEKRQAAKGGSLDVATSLLAGGAGGAVITEFKDLLLQGEAGVWAFALIVVALIAASVVTGYIRARFDQD